MNSFIADRRSSVVIEAERHLASLVSSSVRLCLMSIDAPNIPASLLTDAVRAAAAPVDMVGTLGDGSIAVLSLRGRATDAPGEIEEKFLTRLRLVLMASLFGHDIGPLQFRAVQREACELTDAGDLVDLLMDCEPDVVTIRPPMTM
jgi:hypothetical protein